MKTVYVGKKPAFDREGEALREEFGSFLGIAGLGRVRSFIRYDVRPAAGASPGVDPEGEAWERAMRTVLSEPPVDELFEGSLPDTGGAALFAWGYLPGQYDQRADSAAQCLSALLDGRFEVRCARVVAIEQAGDRPSPSWDPGSPAGDEPPPWLQRAKTLCVNPVDSREIDPALPSLFVEPAPPGQDERSLDGFTEGDGTWMEALARDLGLAMGVEDLLFLRDAYRDGEGRDPRLAELLIFDTYWSDHCRHTTFGTALRSVDFAEGPGSGAPGPVRRAWEDFGAERSRLGRGDREVTLMELATLGARSAAGTERGASIDRSEEINACTVRLRAEVDGRGEDWLLLFKNETHNHPTEIEPYGGAATCLGGAIRDPLSGRAWVHQSMRVTGSADPRETAAGTLPGKLPQRRITRGAAEGFSGYGNQIGLATGQVREWYHPGYKAKRMEIGAVIGAVRADSVRRERPIPGDRVLLVGGRTGRDGIGGATGSSRAHDADSLANSGAEVQKGNAIEERKLQRLFRNGDFSRLVKRCNDFGAGGVAVAVGELAAGLEISLDRVPLKYGGLLPLETALSESQERMAVVVGEAEVRAAIALAAEENLEATEIARVTAEPRLVMLQGDRVVASIPRSLLDSNGAPRAATVRVSEPDPAADPLRLLSRRRSALGFAGALLDLLSDLNSASQKGLGERFDGTIGAASLFLPFGGEARLTPAEGMAALLPVPPGRETGTASFMAAGFDPELCAWSPFHGGLWSVVIAITRIAAMGADPYAGWLSLQEYFERLGTDAAAWGRPLAALLGAWRAQKETGIPAIGGKDSMSGSYGELKVPPTLVAFAVAAGEARLALSPELKRPGSQLLLLPCRRDDEGLPDFAGLKANVRGLLAARAAGRVLAAATVKRGGLLETAAVMAFGNGLGVEFDRMRSLETLTEPAFGGLLLELAGDLDPATVFPGLEALPIGLTTLEPSLSWRGESLSLAAALEAWTDPLEGTFPSRIGGDAVAAGTGKAGPARADPVAAVAGPPGATLPPPAAASPATRAARGVRVARPRVCIPVFPGTNCEYDTERAFLRAGALVRSLVLRNRSEDDLHRSIAELAALIAESQILVFPGGFSAGDEPDGSGKFIASVMRHPALADAVHGLVKSRKGLVLGICNGFQALVKLGLLPFGEIRELSSGSPTLAHNRIGRHVSDLVLTRVASTASPWLSRCDVGELYKVPVSHGEGRLTGPRALLEGLLEGGQVASQYADAEGRPTEAFPWNPNGSDLGIEALSSPDGLILGRMGHSERVREGTLVNIPDLRPQPLFEAGVAWFS